MKKERDSKEQKELRKDPIKLAEDIYWVGAWLEDDDFQCHTYLIREGKDSVLIDPGSLITYPEVIKKIEKLIDPRDVKYFICHHQDPDITACISQYEKDYPREDRLIVTHWKTKTLLKHYNWRAGFYLVDEHDWELKLPSGRVLRFIFTPYAHFAGNICTYDTKTRTLFSSDIFGGFVTRKKLFVEDVSFFEDIKAFHKHYMPSREILHFALNRIEKQEIDLILPQHGYFIPKEFVKEFIERLRRTDCGFFLELELELKSESRSILFLAKLDELLERLYIEALRKSSLTEILNYLYKETCKFYLIENFLMVVIRGGEQKEEQRGRKELLIWKIRSGRNRERQSKRMSEEIEAILKEIEERQRRSGKRCIKVEDLEVELIDSDLRRKGRQVYVVSILEGSGYLILEMEEEQLGLCQQLELFWSRLSEVLSHCLRRELQILRLEEEQKRFYEYAVKDRLTGLYNRFYLEVKLGELEREMRENYLMLSIIMVDIDYFKDVNDRYGHHIGDKVLKMVAELIKGNLRKTDTVARYGGEEFIILLLCTKFIEAYEIAERLRKKVEQTEFVVEEYRIRITISLGVVTVDSKKLKEHSLHFFVKRADELLYQAKKQGRNRVICAYY